MRLLAFLITWPLALSLPSMRSRDRSLSLRGGGVFGGGGQSASASARGDATHAAAAGGRAFAAEEEAEAARAAAAEAEAMRRDAEANLAAAEKFNAEAAALNAKAVRSAESSLEKLKLFNLEAEKRNAQAAAERARVEAEKELNEQALDELALNAEDARRTKPSSREHSWASSREDASAPPLSPAQPQAEREAESNGILAEWNGIALETAKMRREREAVNLASSKLNLFNLARMLARDLLVGEGSKLIAAALANLFLLGPHDRRNNHRRARADGGARLSDVLGCDAAKAEVAQSLAMLRGGNGGGGLRALGARPPRGVLLVGPPGTGKTMLAKVTSPGITAALVTAHHMEGCLSRPPLITTRTVAPRTNTVPSARARRKSRAVRHHPRHKRAHRAPPPTQKARPAALRARRGRRSPRPRPITPTCRSCLRAAPSSTINMRGSASRRRERSGVSRYDLFGRGGCGGFSASSGSHGGVKRRVAWCGVVAPLACTARAVPLFWRPRPLPQPRPASQPSFVRRRCLSRRRLGRRVRSR